MWPMGVLFLYDAVNSLVKNVPKIYFKFPREKNQRLLDLRDSEILKNPVIKNIIKRLAFENASESTIIFQIFLLAKIPV